MTLASALMESNGAQNLAGCLFEASTDPLFLFDVETCKLLNVNRAAEQITGCSQENLAGRTLDRLFGDMTELSRCLETLRLGSPVETCELRLRQRSGRTVDINAEVREIASTVSTLGLLRVGCTPATLAALAAATPSDGRPQEFRLEQALRESESLRARIEQLAEIMTAHVGLDGQWLQVPPELCDFLGYPATSLLGRGVAEFTHPADHARDAADVDRLFAGHSESFTREKRFVCRDGHTVWASVHGWLMTGGSGVPTYLRLHIRDITARMRTEEALRKSENSLLKAQEIAQLGTWELDFETGQLVGSQETYRMLGIAPPDRGQHKLAPAIQEYVHPEDQPFVLEVVQRAVATGTSTPAEFRHVTKSGEIRHLRALAELTRDQDHRIVGMFGTIQDITERKEAELALRESETRFRIIAESCPAMVAIFHGSKICFVNDRVTELLGYAKSDILGHDFEEIVHPEHRELVRERNIRRMQGEHAPARYEFKLLAKDGSACWIDFTAGRFEDNGEPAVLGIAMDITERRSTEERLRQREVELAHIARLSTMGEMVAGIAHEINQPLSAISNFADACTIELSNVQAPQVPQIKQWTELIGQQAVRCGDIIRRLRSYVRQKKVDETSIRVNDVVGESLALLRNEIRQSAIAVHSQFVEPSPEVLGNSVELQQVLVNLLANAHEAIKRSGYSQGELVVRTQTTNGVAHIEVEDNGPGIEPDHLDHLYDAFFTTKPDGLGMGLAISRSIVERHGGRLWVSNRRPHGTVFHIELPLQAGVPRVIR